MSGLAAAGRVAHAMLPAYSRRVEQARGFVREALAQCERPYVAYSGGKDSAVLLHIVAEQCPKVDAQILTGGESRLLHRDLQSILDWWRDHTQVNLMEVHVDTVFSDAWQDASFEESYAQFYDGWNKYLHDKGHDGVFIGLRRQEAGARDMLYRRFGPVHRYAADRKDVRAGIVLACPLFNLLEQDVWAYVTTYQIPTFEAYEQGNERTKTRLGWRAMNEFGQLAELRVRDPAAFNAIVTRFPELRRLGG